MLFLLGLEPLGVRKSIGVARLQALGIKVQVSLPHRKLQSLPWDWKNAIELSSLFLELWSLSHDLHELLLLFPLHDGVLSGPSRLFQNFVNLMSDARLLLPVYQDVCILIQPLRQIFAWNMQYGSFIRIENQLTQLFQQVKLTFNNWVVTVPGEPLSHELLGDFVILVDALLSFLHFDILLGHKVLASVIPELSAGLGLPHEVKFLAVKCGTLHEEVMDQLSKLFHSVLLGVIRHCFGI